MVCSNLRPEGRRPGLDCWNCERTHRSWYRYAWCRWRRAIWISGDPPVSGPCFALVAACGRGTTVTLHESRAEAEKDKARIDRLACGGQCWRAHRIVALHEDLN